MVQAWSTLKPSTALLFLCFGSVASRSAALDFSTDPVVTVKFMRKLEQLHCLRYVVAWAAEVAVNVLCAPSVSFVM